LARWLKQQSSITVQEKQTSPEEVTYFHLATICLP
jgi:hypothetical protein